jgi:L-glutamine:2-deoxy-scyllo-inosose/3-amino-2,3-dideoxy-scyllo-inosose aminotransferase
MLAIDGGRPVRNIHTKPWPTWPRWGYRERELLEEVLESGVWSYNGPKERALLGEWAHYLGTGRAVAVANGTVSLQLALEALDIGWGDEVIVPGLTWQATAAAVLDVNAVPILVDVEPQTWCIDPAAVRRALTPRTRAIIPVHLYGAMADMDQILEIAKTSGTAVVEDTAHQHGSEWNGRKAGTVGDIGSFSLQLSKVLTSGEGGLLCTNAETLWERLDALRNCGRRPAREEDASKGAGVYQTEGDFIQSGNYRITEFQAAVLLAALERLPQELSHREERAAWLDTELSAIEGVTVIQPHPQQNRRSYFNYAFMVDPDRFGGGGIAPERIRRALGAELGTPVASCYAPLTNCPLYRPHTKRRYHISDAHWAAIDPTRFNLPVCAELYEKRAVTLHHSVLLDDRSGVQSVVEAVQRLSDEADALRR